MQKIRVLNLYAGIGGNRKLWENVEVTAVEIKEGIAMIYREGFPEDHVVIGDAHRFLLEHYKEYDFIWSSPPCPSHSRLRAGFSIANGAKPIFPDMRLYEEIIFLQNFFKGKWVVENVVSYYEPLIRPYELDRHYFWSNFMIPIKTVKDGKINLTGGWEKQDDGMQIKQLEDELGFDLKSYKMSLVKKRRILRNCVKPVLGLHIFECSQKEKQRGIFDYAK